MKYLYAILIFSATIILTTTSCYSQADKVADKHCSDEHHATYTKVEADTSERVHKASCRCGNLNVTYEGPIPQRRSLCHCNSCQLRTGTAFSIQARFPRDKVVIEGESSEWKFPNKEGQEVTYRSCDSGGATYHFCPTCGSTVYWDIEAAPDVVGIAIGSLTDPTFPAPIICGFEAYGHPWAMTPADLDFIRLEYDEIDKPIKQ